MLYKWPTLALILFITANLASAQRAANSPFTFAPFIEPDFPFITTTLNAGTIGPMYPEHNMAVRCLVLQLGNDTHACFDTDLLRVAATWTGESISLLSMPQISYHQAGNKTNGIPEILGDPITATGLYPGWQGAQVSFDDPRPEGPNPKEAGRGPVPAHMGRWLGASVTGNQAVLRYQALGVDISETLHAVTSGNQTGVVRTFEIAPHTHPLTVVLGEFRQISRHHITPDQLRIHHSENTMITAFSATAEGAELALKDGRYTTLHISPNSNKAVIHVVMWKGLDKNLPAFKDMVSTPSPAIPDVSEGGRSRWGEPAFTAGLPGQPQGAFAIDVLSLPLPNKWQRNVRVSGLDFFSDGRAAVSTFEGDVWLVSGIQDNLQRLSWQRFASGLCEPMSLSIVDDEVYVFGREGIVKLVDLNADGEADFYKNFSNLMVQTGESREYPLSMHAHPQGGFILSLGSALNAGPKTSPAVMDGFRAGGPHSGSILRVSADGQRITQFATGLREPYASVHPETGWITASDQQGNFVPSTPVYLIEEGDYLGVPATAHRPVLPEVKNPITWIPHALDRSATEQVWMTTKNMGPLNDALVHLSYGKPGIYKIYHDGTRLGGVVDIPVTFTVPLMKGKINPSDGLLYLSGFQVWDSDAKAISGLSRLRYTGGALSIPLNVDAGQQGILLQFEQNINPASAAVLSNYFVERWNYQRTESYGSGHFDLSGAPGHEVTPVVSAALSDDHRTVFLQVHDMKEVMQMGIRYKLLSAQGDSLSHTLYLTLNKLIKLDLSNEGFPDLALVAESAGADTQQTEKSTPVASANRGNQIYLNLGCVACHSTDGSTEGRSGPTFKGLYKNTRLLTDGSTIIADEGYITESILEPAARVVAGKEVEMPSYAGVISQSDLESLVLFIKSIND